MVPARFFTGCSPALALLTLGAVAGADPGYVGSAACGECHEAEYSAWRGSHHDLAMAQANEDTVLGDFADARFTAHGVTSTFYRKDGGYFVHTDGPDGELRHYPIRYTFGWDPLQQYLVEFPRGRLQSLGIAWDSRPKEQGGQRWFHLYPKEKGMDHRHRLHWTSREQNWNYQCAECHSTELQKHYDLETDAFATTWEEIDVACEACHGPGARHLDQARRAALGEASAWDPDKGLVVGLRDSDGGRWIMDPDTGTARRTSPRQERTEIELCARCHARRGQVSEDYVYGEPLANTHRLALLDEHLYHADGQILEEVYVYGSFIQSRMSRAGVTCTDCHDPHSLALKAPGDLVCAQCHEAGRFASESHHHHRTDSPGASCVGCHMPQSLYMVIDERADHSMRVPRPDLTLELGTPNACSKCHTDKPVQWAAETFNDWYGSARSGAASFAPAIHAGRNDAPDAGAQLMALAVDAEQPAIARATALDLLRGQAQPNHRLALPRLLADPDPLVRSASVRYLEAMDADATYRLGMPMLEDPVRTVRLDAARALAPLLRYELPPVEHERLAGGLDAYRAAQLATAERPESHLNIALVEALQGKAAAARRSYRTALRLDTAFVPAYVNLADLYRALGDDAEGEAVLRAGIAAAPGNADLHHALGLLQVRTGRIEDAAAELREAAQLAPGNPRYAYVHALALKETGDVEGALSVLEAAYRLHPSDRELLIALVTLNRDAGRRQTALAFAQALAQRYPNDSDATLLLRQLSDAQ